MEMFANDPILKNTHFFYEMTREEKMEHNYQRMPVIYKKIPEDLTYKNIFDYVLLVGPVSDLIICIKTSSYRFQQHYIMPCLNWQSAI
jgi:hypothetical protein